MQELVLKCFWAKQKRKKKAPLCELHVQVEAAGVKFAASVLNFYVSNYINPSWLMGTEMLRPKLKGMMMA